MSNLSAAKVRSDFAEVVNRVSFGKERIVITRRGKNLAAVVPVEDLELLQALEDKMDLIDAKAALKEAKNKSLKKWAQLKSEMGL